MNSTPRERVYSHVTSKVLTFTTTQDTAATRAMLARLRANVGKEPGSDPAIWAATIENVSPNATNDTPTWEENAVHTALTLYAAHQQSRPQPVHTQKIGFGQAVKQLDHHVGRGDGDGPSPVRRRFNAAVSSATFTELAYHLRGLIRQMRGESIAFDYGRFAVDLWDFQVPGKADAVRRRWAREYYRINTGDADNTRLQEETTTEEETS